MRNWPRAAKPALVPAALLLALALACRPARSPVIQLDASLATLVPAETTLLAGIRMEAVRATPVYRKWIAGRPSPTMDSFAGQTGIDPRKDIWEILFVSAGGHITVLARGKFSQTGLEPKIPGATRTPYRSYTLIGNEKAAVVFLNPTTAIAGSPAAVRAIIDQRDGPGHRPSPLLDRVKAISSRNQFWMVSSGGFGALEKAIPSEGNFANLGRIVAMLDAASATADLSNGLELSAEGICRSEADAQTLNDALRGMIGLARLTTADNESQLLRAYDSLQVSRTGRTVRLHAPLPPDLLDQLLTKAESMHGHAGAPPAL